MNFKKLTKKIAIISLSTILVLTLGGCKKKKPGDDTGGEVNKTYYDNETAPLMFSSQELDKVFNPFFSTSASDGNVVGMTQIGMLGNDSKGNYTYGDSEAVVVKDLQIVSSKEDDKEYTTYYFVLKNNVRYSNGSYLTMKDVLFNLYVYLDPAYDGSSTIYSTDIVGLKEYRTQTADENEQDSFKKQFEIKADTRIDALKEAIEMIKDENPSTSYTEQSLKTALHSFTQDSGLATYKNIVKDYEKAIELFKEELKQDFNNSIDGYQDIVFTDEKGNLYKNLLTTNVEAFLYNEGYITWNKKEAKLSSIFVNDVKELKNWTEEKAINTIFATKIPDAIDEVLSYWQTSVNLFNYIVNEETENYFKNGSERLYKNISGIKFANKEEAVTVNGVTYGVPTYSADGKANSCEVLSIKIHDVDPKAIWNFAFSVAPMYYYSDKAHIDAFDYEENFGVEYYSQSFMNSVVKNATKNGVPVGAGAYAASRSSGGIDGVTPGEFYNLGVIYYERNPYFVMGPATIKKVRFQVVASAQMLNSLYNGEIDFCEPNAKPDTITELNSKVEDGISNKSIRTSGYGYIGINAGKVPSLAVRQAIMHCINTNECVQYYGKNAEPVYRSMSKANWAYPKNATPYYPCITQPIPEDLSVVNPAYAMYVTKLGKKAGQVLTKEEQRDFIIDLVEGDGYSLNANGVYEKQGKSLKYTFTIAGEETDHPAWNALFHAAELLNGYGFQITVTTDGNALKKLATGDLTVWAAAWGSTIDPDMYQVYHRASTATSVLNWGYKQILLNVGGKYDTEVAIIDELSDIIEAARKINDQTKRAELYSQALDLVMQLAVELPTYQREDLFAYNSDKIDASTFTPSSELSPYKGLTSDLYTVSLYVEK